MKKLGIYAIAAAVACAAAPAAAAPIITFDGTSGAFSNANIGLGSFDDLIPFTTGTGVLAADVVSIAVSNLTDIDFTSVTLNGIPFTPDDTDGAGVGREEWYITGLNVTAGPQQLRIQGNSGGNGSYAGTIAFAARQVPEPAGWTTMLLALGLLGGSLKLSRRQSMKSATA
jgi:hypothetical protein